jgi:hypothetical protein
MGTRMNSQAKVQDEINLHNQEKRAVSGKSNGRSVVNLVGTISNTSFTQLATFARRYIPLPIVYFVSLHEESQN